MKFKHRKRSRLIVGQDLSHSPAEILKVQLPLASNMATPQALVYNRDRSCQGFIDVTDELRAHVGSEIKTFWYGVLEGTSLTLFRKAPWQDW